jgi:hypothetical protein
MTRPAPRPRIDWGAALAWYVAMPLPRSFPAVARQFGVSDTAVRRHAQPGNDTPEGWDAIANAVDRKAAADAMRDAERTVGDRQRQLLRIYDRASQLVEDALDPEKLELSLEQVFQKFPELHRIYRLETEQATDHVALAEVQAGFRAAMRVAIETAAMVAGSMLPERKAAEFVRAYREAFLPAVNAALTIGGEQ